MARAKKSPRAARRTPTVLQNEVTECGAACLAMILGAYGRFVPLEEIRYVAGVSRDGTKASNLVRAGMHYGLKSRGLSCQPADLATLKLPAIVFWNFDHFVVLERINATRAWINDPAVGPRVLAIAEFDQAFTGVTLVFEPGPDFTRGGRRPSVAAGIRARIAAFTTSIAAIFIVGVLMLVPGLAIPGLQRTFTDYYLVLGLHEWLWWLIGGLALAAALRMLLTYLQHHSLARFNVRLALNTNGRLLWHILHMPLGFFAQRNTGELATRTGLGDRLSSLMSGSLISAAVSLLSIVVYGLVMAGYDLALTLVAVAFAALNLWLLSILSRKLSHAHRRMLQEDGRLQAMLFQGFASLDSFRASGTEDLFFRRWAGAHAKVVGAEQAIARWRRLLANFVILLGAITGIAIVLVGGLRVMDGVITIGMLVAFQTLVSNFNAPVSSFVNLGSQLQDMGGYVDRLDDILRQRVDPLFRPDRATRALTVLRGRIDVENVAFGYSEVSKPVVANLDFSVAPGRRVAIVGPSGSGKSTLGRLLAGLAMPRTGRILIDGVPVGELATYSLRGAVGYVEQAVTLFPGTIRDNITLWDPTSDDNRVVHAAKDAMLHATISSRPKAYDSVIDEDGSNFSGGECQRLAIARALATNPAIVVLDEATSALDAMAEKGVIDNIRRRGCTCVIISHRLSAVRDCDEIFVLDRGAIVERGRHEELIAHDGLYKSLVQA
jgi:NHLM bacteriocin system ABC transporter peptidase/ATP-binding protein